MHRILSVKRVLLVMPGKFNDLSQLYILEISVKARQIFARNRSLSTSPLALDLLISRLQRIGMISRGHSERLIGRMTKLLLAVRRKRSETDREPPP